MSNSYNCLGVAYQLSGKCELAKRYRRSFENIDYM
jgi:hypothetical protein